MSTRIVYTYRKTPGIPLAKKINGTYYYYYGQYKTKDDVTKSAKKVRGKGFKARILLFSNLKNNVVYAVYYRISNDMISKGENEC